MLIQGLKKGPFTAEEDALLKQRVEEWGELTVMTVVIVAVVVVMMMMMMMSMIVVMKILLVLQSQQG